MEYNLTEEQKKDVVARSESFRQEYQALIEKHQVDFLCLPEYVPTKDGFVTVCTARILDKKYLPIKSPMQKESIIQ